MYKAHLFICTNSPDKEGKCGHKMAEKLQAEVKEHFRHVQNKQIRINKSGCLGQCENGVAAVLYPENKWFLNLTDQDAKKLIAAVEKAVNS